MSYNLPHDPDVDGPAIWERQTDESNLHYEWFHVYLLLGPGRSMRAAYNQFQAQKAGVSSLVVNSNQDSVNLAPSKSWRSACAQWNWLERASAWDQNQRVLNHAAREKWSHEMGLRAETSIEQLLVQSDEMQKFAEKILSWPLHQTTSINNGQTIVIEPTKWTLDTGVRMMLASLKATETSFKIYVELDVLRARETARSQSAASEDLMNRAMRSLDALEKEEAGKPLTPTQQRGRENMILDALEASLLHKVQSGTPGAVERLLRVAQRRARLNGLDKPFDPNDEVKPKKRRDLSHLTKAELDLLEEISNKYDAPDDD